MIVQQALRLMNRTKILLAEDDDLLRDLVLSQLRASGYDVHAAVSGDTALLAVLSGLRVHVLVTDINMPGALDGWSLAERCRSLMPHIAVIYTSSGKEDARRQVGDSFFLQKPYHPNMLLEALERFTAPMAEPGS